MDVLILNGSLKHQTHLMPIQKLLVDEFEGKGWNTEPVLLHEIDVWGCLGCFKCWDTTPGLCIQQKDKARGIVEKMIQCDLLVFLTPLTFGGYSSELKKIIERSLGLLQPGMKMVHGESHHLKRYDRYPSLLAFGVAEKRDAEEEKIFKTLIDRHSLNFYPPRHRAEVFLAAEEEGKIREKIKSFVSEMEPGR
jgi:multimeric flavodoxin WrbA